MSEYEKLKKESDKRLTEYYLKCIQVTEERYAKEGGKIKGTAVYAVYPKEKKHGVKEILEASKTWGIPVVMDLPIERVDFDVEKVILVGENHAAAKLFADSQPVIRTITRQQPTIHYGHPFFDKKSIVDDEPKTRWEKAKRWFKKRWNKALKREDLNNRPCGMYPLANMTFNEVLENLHTRKVKHALNEMLTMAGIPEESWDETEERLAAAEGRKLPYKKDREENRFKLTPNQKRVEWFIRKKKSVKRGLSQLWSAIRG